MDYIYCIAYGDQAAQPHLQALEVTDTTVSCILAERQRSSQQILDLADYLKMHYKHPVRRYDSQNSFSSEIPIWIELTNSKSSFNYFKDKFLNKDVMLIWDSSNKKKPSNLSVIEELCRERRWRCTTNRNVRGSEASVTILYDFDSFDYEFLTRAKVQLVIVTINGKERYFL